MTERFIPLLRSPAVALRDLEREFGGCAGMHLGDDEAQVGADGRVRWCAALFPAPYASNFADRRHKGGQPGPFLLALGSFEKARKRGGVGGAFSGVALVAGLPLPAADLLHPDQLAGNSWPEGFPYLRAWLCHPPRRFADLTGAAVRLGLQHARRFVPLDDVEPGLRDALLDKPLLHEAGLDRPRPLTPGTLAEAFRAVEGGRRQMWVGQPVRDDGLVRRALAANFLGFGEYTCEDCGYRPACDPRVPRSEAASRSMLDVHHVVPLEAGERESTAEDLIVLCPLCHRRRHVMEGMGQAAGPS